MRSVRSARPCAASPARTTRGIWPSTGRASPDDELAPVYEDPGILAASTKPIPFARDENRVGRRTTGKPPANLRAIGREDADRVSDAEISAHSQHPDRQNARALASHGGGSAGIEPHVSAR